MPAPIICYYKSMLRIVLPIIGASEMDTPYKDFGATRGIASVRFYLWHPIFLSRRRLNFHAPSLPRGQFWRKTIPTCRKFRPNNYITTKHMERARNTGEAHETQTNLRENDEIIFRNAYRTKTESAKIYANAFYIYLFPEITFRTIHMKHWRNTGGSGRSGPKTTKLNPPQTSIQNKPVRPQYTGFLGRITVFEPNTCATRETHRTKEIRARNDKN